MRTSPGARTIGSTARTHRIYTVSLLLLAILTDQDNLMAFRADWEVMVGSDWGFGMGRCHMCCRARSTGVSGRASLCRTSTVSDRATTCHHRTTGRHSPRNTRCLPSTSRRASSVQQDSSSTTATTYRSSRTRSRLRCPPVRRLRLHTSRRYRLSRRACSHLRRRAPHRPRPSPTRLWADTEATGCTYPVGPYSLPSPVPFPTRPSHSATRRRRPRRCPHQRRPRHRQITRPSSTCAVGPMIRSRKATIPVRRRRPRMIRCRALARLRVWIARAAGRATTARLHPRMRRRMAVGSWMSQKGLTLRGGLACE